MGTTLVSGQDRTLHLEILHVPVFTPLRWIGRGWRDLRRHPSASLGYGALIVALGWTLLVFCATHPYFVAAAITGFLLVGPAMSAGLCEMSRRFSLGQPATFDDSLEGFVRNASALAEFGAILALFGVVWFALSAVLLGTVFHIAEPSISETMYKGFIDSANRSQVLAYVGVGGLFAAGVFAISVVAIPLIIDRHATAAQAMLASIKAVLSNIPAMIVWSALILMLTVIGYAPLLFGLLIAAPLLGHATWHAYRDMVR
ncbi:MAG TPA: DUF2189 domain-containing protein [Steroidobacteraceae bacterium]|nr:DUF2189 domain-containing protein [Steroidobacteraceae bacterium]